jgi:hypothetical protein
MGMIWTTLFKSYVLFIAIHPKNKAIAFYWFVISSKAIFLKQSISYIKSTAIVTLYSAILAALSSCTFHVLIDP